MDQLKIATFIFITGLLGALVFLRINSNDEQTDQLECTVQIAQLESVVNQQNQAIQDATLFIQHSKLSN